jgi:hypothetical protein
VARVFWIGVGAAAGVWAYKRGERAIERARERGMVGNIAAATTTATKVAATAGRAVSIAAEQGARVATRLASPSDPGTSTTQTTPAGTAAPARPAVTPPNVQEGRT